MQTPPITILITIKQIHFLMRVIIKPNNKIIIVLIKATIIIYAKVFIKNHHFNNKVKRSKRVNFPTNTTMIQKYC